jgi:hypothetical protein
VSGCGVPRSRRATVADLRQLAGSMPGVRIEHGPKGNDVYQVSRRSFVFFRTPRPDAVDPATGERYDDVVVLWVGSEIEKQALVADESTPFFTTPHFDGHSSVLLGELAGATSSVVRGVLTTAHVSHLLFRPYSSTTHAHARIGSRFSRFDLGEPPRGTRVFPASDYSDAGSSGTPGGRGPT